MAWKNLHATDLKRLGNMARMNLRLLTFVWRFCFLFCVGGAVAHAQGLMSPVVTTPQVRAELVAHAPQGVQPGATLMLGLLLKHQPGWHTYWLNPGDSGLPTQLNWTLPEGLKAGATLWPLPDMIPVANMVNHGFEDQVLLGTQVQIDKNFQPSNTLELRLNAEWLVCKEECIPQSGQFLLTLNPQASTAGHAAVFAQLQEQQPTALQPAAQIATLSGETLRLDIQGLPPTVQGRPLKAYAQSPEVLASGLGLSGKTGEWQNGRWQLAAPLHAFRNSTPNNLGLMLVDDSTPTPRAWTVRLNIQGDWPAISTTPMPATASPMAPKPKASSISDSSLPPASVWALASAILGAFFGGLLLNLMPCVLPVLAIKVLSLTQHHHNTAERRAIGVVYALGVIASMLALALLVAGLRASGQQLGWGFQLQSPLVVSLLALVFTLIALNLLGVLNFQAHWSSGLAAQWVRHPLADAFLSGVLAVVVAAPCTAPFMGASVGIALTLPLWQGLLIFTTLGLGLALPFTLLTWVPAWARWLPRPGMWMERLRQMFAFPMLATVVWLLWVLGQQTSIDGMAVMLAMLLLVSACVWALGLTGRAKWLGLGLWGGLLAVLLFTWGPLVWQEPTTESTPQVASSSEWQSWSEDKVQSALKQGRPVFIDFTAAWCVTCQVNKQTTLRNPQVLKAFAEKNVLLLRADWTRRDPAITQALGRLGRSGVPVYVLQSPDQPAQVLSEVLSPDLMRQALSLVPLPQ
jgi:thiol:disulfide interchange protein DsbD